jgi:hypothetical protein
MTQAQNKKFKRDLDFLIKKAGGNATQFVKSVALRVDAALVEKSAVDTGRFRANWNLSINGVDTSTTEDKDKEGRVTVAKSFAALSAFRLGDTINITNSLPYALRLEYGYSKQKPLGMVRLTIAELGEYFSTAAAKLR